MPRSGRRTRASDTPERLSPSSLISALSCAPPGATEPDTGAPISVPVGDVTNNQEIPVHRTCDELLTRPVACCGSQVTRGWARPAGESNDDQRARRKPRPAGDLA